MRRVLVLLITLALLVGMVGCPADPEPTPPVEYSLTISSTEGGSGTSPGEGTFTYDDGEVVDLMATPASGYSFVGWTGHVSTIANVYAASTTITMRGDYAIKANFQLIPLPKYNLIISSTEGGSVTAPGQGTLTYDAGTVVVLVAEAEEGHVFVGWTGDVTEVVDADAASTGITVEGDYSITANFAIGIWDWYDLDAIRDDLGGSYVLMNDLDSTKAGYSELASQIADGAKGWQPIGSLSVDPSAWYLVHPLEPFTGDLDGQGHVIRDLFVVRPDEDGVGLFGCVGGGVIENLGVVNGEVTGRRYVGGLVADNDGTVNNSYFAGNVLGQGESWPVGGLVAANRRTVSNSYSICRVIGAWAVGGLVGSNWGAVSNSYFTGSVTGETQVGGLAGASWGTVDNSCSTGSLTGKEDVGGLVGGGSGPVINSYYDYDQVVINDRSIITIGALCSGDFEQWLANDKSLDVSERLSLQDGYYLINDVNDFKSLLAFGQNGALKFRLTNDLDLGDEPDFYIPYLAGEFDGSGHTIANLSFSCNFVSHVGLFGYLAPGGIVNAVCAENVDMTGRAMVGGLVGENNGSVSNSYATGRVAGYGSLGGLVGWMGWHGATVSNCYYSYDEFRINGRQVITIGALLNEDFDQWLVNGKSLDVNGRLSQEDGYYLINDVGDFEQLLAFGQDATLRFRLTDDLDLGDKHDFYIPYLAGELDGNGHRISNLRVSIDFVAQVGLFGYLGSGAKVSGVGVESADITVAGGGEQQAGALAGGSVGKVSTSYSTGSVTGEAAVGGLVGWNGGAVSDSYSTCSVSGPRVGGLVGWNYRGTVSNSYSIGSVAGRWDSGGLVGFGGGTVDNSFWDTLTSGRATSHGGTGKTTAELKSTTTFLDAGWSIATVANPSARNLSYTWNIVDGQAYPLLSWQPVT